MDRNHRKQAGKPLGEKRCSEEAKEGNKTVRGLPIKIHRQELQPFLTDSFAIQQTNAAKSSLNPTSSLSNLNRKKTANIQRIS
jgi:hypothetical protein